MTTPRYDRDSLPQGRWRYYTPKQAILKKMIEVEGPFTVVTREGEYGLAEGWRGYIAVDTAGYPYPIAAEEHERTYTQVDLGGE